jgi:hypothetical protein
MDKICQAYRWDHALLPCIYDQWTSVKTCKSSLFDAEKMHTRGQNHLLLYFRGIINVLGWL